MVAKGGWEVLLVARSVDKLEAVKQEILAAGGAASAVQCDITCVQQVMKMQQVHEIIKYRNSNSGSSVIW